VESRLGKTKAGSDKLKKRSVVQLLGPLAYSKPSPALRFSAAGAVATWYSHTLKSCSMNSRVLQWEIGWTTKMISLAAIAMTMMLG
jgi:hypothetical protein